MSTLQRTRDNFPRMRVRGGRRRNYQRTSQQRNAMTALGSIPWAKVAEAFGEIAVVMVNTAITFKEFEEQWRKSVKAAAIPDAESDTTTVLLSSSGFSGRSALPETAAFDPGLPSASPGTSRLSHEQ